MDDVRALNNAFAAETSYLDSQAWRHLIVQARLAVCVPGEKAFLIALDQDAQYDSPNYLWWQQRRERFLYIDRLVVAANLQGIGLGRMLYQYAIAEASARNLKRVVCEINVDPPNPASLHFHQKLGFSNVGEQLLSNGKTVGYFERML